MLKKLNRRINRWKFKRSVRKLRNTEFCLVANNCFGSRIYKILGREYNTPFVGLLLMPECFAKLVADFDGYMDQNIRFINNSKYPLHRKARRGEGLYPLGLLGDLEIHFLHYKSEEDALDAWERRKARINREHLYFILIANGPCDETVMAQFIGQDSSKKVCFHRQKNLETPGCIYIPSKKEHMGNLYSQYQRFVGRFDFAEWIMNRNPEIGRQRKQVRLVESDTCR
jgi:uncharacterized protein (DUF1919 family)